VTATQITRRIGASRSAVYAALVDPHAVQHWMVPTGMTSVVHEFSPFEGGTFRISLTYDGPTDAGKTDAQTDTFHGRFARLVPDRQVVQVVEFESADPVHQGEMTITYTLSDDGDGTLLTAHHENLPPGLSPEENELGWNISIDKLAALVERQP
jgi:uncharacterized protein YndB with AHSA1/START domain